MTPEVDKYWFPAKRYGWGWGPPCRWQGWVVLVGFILFNLLGPVVFRLPKHWLMFALYEVILCTALIVICWKKGEPPRWRPGDGE